MIIKENGHDHSRLKWKSLINSKKKSDTWFFFNHSVYLEYKIEGIGEDYISAVAAAAYVRVCCFCCLRCTSLLLLLPQMYESAVVAASDVRVCCCCSMGCILVAYYQQHSVIR